MKHIKLFDAYNITSTTGNKIVSYFETGQGSKYLRTDKGETKRYKVEHANTGTDDIGLKDWYQNSFFVDPKFEYEANSIQFLIDKGFKCALNIKDSKGTIYIIEDNKWRIGNKLDAYPKAGQKGDLIFDITDKVTIGYNAVEYNLGTNKFSIKNYHFGSPVTKIINADKITDNELKYFKK